MFVVRKIVYFDILDRYTVCKYVSIFTHVVCICIYIHTSLHVYIYIHTLYLRIYIYSQRKFRLRNFRYTNDISVKLSQVE